MLHLYIYYTDTPKKIKHHPQSRCIFWLERVMPMDHCMFYIAGSTPACGYAKSFLQAAGVCIAEHPSGDLTHLLLDVPSFGPEGKLRGGGSLEELLEKLPKNVIVCGGNLKHPSLTGYAAIDLLRSEEYIAQNAYLTAECALDVAMPYLSITLRECPVLILGWGRIGKCLARLLGSICSDITIAARKETDRAMIGALGYGAVDYKCDLSYYRLIFNTVPAPVLNREQMSHCNPDCVKIDLASVPGMDDADVIHARGLPGIHVPESSGKLIAETLIKLL